MNKEGRISKDPTLIIPYSLFNIRYSLSLSASIQIRALFEKAQIILRLYGKYPNPKSE